jgi:hypothetical protein
MAKCHDKMVSDNTGYIMLTYLHPNCSKKLRLGLQILLGLGLQSDRAIIILAMIVIHCGVLQSHENLVGIHQVLSIEA